MHDQQITHQLSVLRAAIEALRALGDDLPDPARLQPTLQALDPALSGDAFGPPAWVSSTGMPAPRWLLQVAARRERLVEEGDASDPSDGQILRATSLDAELAQRLIARRTFRRFVRRYQAFPPAGPQVCTFGDGPWWTWDHVLDDGRWARVRVRGDAPRRPVGDAWLHLAFDELQAEVGRDEVRRCLVGPAWRDASGAVVGLLATLEATGEAPITRLALDRMCAEDVAAEHVAVVPFAVPSAG